MILQIRIDERLIHGQITTSWSRQLNPDIIAVANDRMAADDLGKKVLLMACPAGIKANIRSVADTVRLLKDPRGRDKRIFVIVDCPKDALTLVRELGVKDVNVANFTKKKSPDKVQLTQFVRADKEDVEYFKQLAEETENLFSQMLPGMTPEDFKQILKNKA